MKSGFASPTAALKQNSVANFAATYRDQQQQLFEHFLAGANSADLVRQRVEHTDTLVQKLWGRCFGEHAEQLTLLAVGGYGRAELQPHSDLDLLIVTEQTLNAELTAAIERFVTLLWDIGLEVGHSVRTVAQCNTAASADVTVMTNLLEARLLCGNTTLYDQVSTNLQTLWPDAEFFRAKINEQTQRYHKFDDTAYKLEPNVKESPGGLRDIHTVSWVAKRHFGTQKLAELVEQDFLTHEELATLSLARDFLWQVRFVLHNLTGRKEDRLLFDLQRDVAHQFGYLDDTNNLAVEQFMQRYYRTVMEVERLNEMLLQHFEEDILHRSESSKPTPISKRFQARKSYLEAVDDEVFLRYPPALLELFIELAQHPEIKGVRASTVRLIRRHKTLIDSHFRADPITRQLFLKLFQQPQGLTHQLRRMNRYGILAAYLPEFELIVGRMQYDLFHIYTVDEHSLFVVRNLRRFAVPKFAAEFPLCSQLMSDIDKPEILYFAGLFHDIAKGRGGDHSELGANDAYQFCLRHGLTKHDAEIVAWLVRNHLLMSVTAQRKDLSDEQVIIEFANKIQSLLKLQLLYLLTVADIRGTNPALWNSWKDNLLRELLSKAAHHLHPGKAKILDNEQRIANQQTKAMELLLDKGLNKADIQTTWQQFDADYFLRHNIDEICWHTIAVHEHQALHSPLVLVRGETQRGGTEVLIYADDHDNLFALVTALLDRLQLDTVDARISTTEMGKALDTFMVLDRDGRPIQEPFRLQDIETTLSTALLQPDRIPTPALHRIPRLLRHFEIPLELKIYDTPDGDRTVVELSSSDRPGLLAHIGLCFSKSKLRIHRAKVSTVGERVEDVFYVTDRQDRPIAATESANQLSSTLHEELQP